MKEWNKLFYSFLIFFAHSLSLRLASISSASSILSTILDASFKKDKEIVLEAVKQAGEDALEFADKSLRKDKDIVKASKQK